MTRGPPVYVLCVLGSEQRQAYQAELAELTRLGVELVHEDSPDHALDTLGARKFPLLIVGMTVEMMDGLEFLALLMQRQKDFAGKVVVLPDKGDPFPPMLQFRDPRTGKSATEAIDLARLAALASELVASSTPKRREQDVMPARAPEPAAKPPKAQKPKLPPRAPAPRAPETKQAAGSQDPKRVEPSPAAPVELAVAPPPPQPVVEPPPQPVVEPPPQPVVEPPPQPVVEPPPQPVVEPPPPVVAPSVETLSPALEPLEPVLAASMRAVPPSPAPRRRGPVVAGLVALGVLALATVVVVRACLAPSGAERVAEVAAPSASATKAPTLASAPAVVEVATPEATPRDLTQPLSLPLSFAKRHADYSIADSARLDAIVSDVAKQLDENPGTRLEVGGHTSKEGAEGFNFELGQRRADGAKSYLIAHGVSASRVVLKNYGASQPTADPEADRRVTVRLIGSREGTAR